MPSLNGKKIVFTGFRDDELKSRIENAGGQVLTSVSNKTDILVTKESNSKSSKAEKARQYSVELISKQDFETKYFGKNGLFKKLEKLFGSKKEDAKQNTNKPNSNVATKITGTRKYLIHDNGGRPFEVVMTSATFSVSRQSQIQEQGKGWTFYEGPYDKFVIKPTKYLHIFIGRCPENGKKFDGNSILVQLTAKTYMYIGSRIYTFKVKDNILGYKSPIYGSDVAYPYAVGTRNTYLMLDETYFVNEDIKTRDPYDTLYNMPHKQRLEHIRKHKLENFKVLQERL